MFQTDKKPGKHREAPRWARCESNSRDGPVEDDRECSQWGSLGTARGVPNAAYPQDIQLGQTPDRNDDNPSLTNRVMATILTRPSDALDVLFDAARPGQSIPEESASSQTRVQNVSPNSSSGVSSNIVSESGLIPVSCLSRPSEEILDLWDKCRFVRQGWFTAQEAVTYLDLYGYTLLFDL